MKGAYREAALGSRAAPHVPQPGSSSLPTAPSQTPSPETPVAQGTCWGFSRDILVATERGRKEVGRLHLLPQQSSTYLIKTQSWCPILWQLGLAHSWSLTWHPPADFVVILCSGTVPLRWLLPYFSPFSAASHQPPPVLHMRFMQRFATHRCRAGALAW